MSPESFNFKVTVPADDRLVGVVRDLCAHAASYAKLAEADGDAFCDRVAAAAIDAVERSAGAPCATVFDCEGGMLRVTIGGQTISQPLSA
ncbi:MAG: hypothetical protein IT179_09360 [Acidobacteria bacterium]|nr:hypothetical protein [Acidobacteriota bacterium]